MTKRKTIWLTQRLSDSRETPQGQKELTRRALGLPAQRLVAETVYQVTKLKNTRIPLIGEVLSTSEVDDLLLVHATDIKIRDSEREAAI